MLDLYIRIVHSFLRHAFLYNFDHVYIFRHSVTAYVEHARESKSCRNGFSGFEYSVEKNSAQIPTAASTNFSRDHFRARILAPLRAQLQSPTTCNWSRKLRKNPHCRGTDGRMCEECYFLFINPAFRRKKRKEYSIRRLGNLDLTFESQSQMRIFGFSRCKSVNTILFTNVLPKKDYNFFIQINRRGITLKCRSCFVNFCEYLSIRQN